MTASERSTLTLADLRQFTGDDIRYRHSLNRRVIYTPGVRYMAEKGGAYWLVDDIAILIGSSMFKAASIKDDRIGCMHFWRLTVSENRSAVLEARADGPEKPFLSQAVPWTDFPLDQVELWAAFDGENWTIYLPSEH